MSIDKERLKTAFTKAAHTYEQEASVQQQIAAKLYNMLSRYLCCPPSSILEIGCGTGFLTRLLSTHFHPENITVNDLCPEMANYIPNNINFIPGDAEIIDFPNKYDLIASSSAIQWLTDLSSFLKKMDQKLSSNGILAISTFGEKNLSEIKYITDKGLNYPSRSELEQLIAPSFQILEIKENTHSLYFSSPWDVLIHMKHTGVNGINTDRWTNADMKHFIDRYNKLFYTDNKVSLTYHPIYIIATKK
ncbi:malonyl-ACP O-methyltransferase BioC [Coprobacter sp.]